LFGVPRYGSGDCGDSTSGDDWGSSLRHVVAVGVVLDAPNISADAKRMNFTNLARGRKICFSKREWMWLLQQCVEIGLGRASVDCGRIDSECERLPAPQMFLMWTSSAYAARRYARQNQQTMDAGFPAFAMNERDIPDG